MNRKQSKAAVRAALTVVENGVGDQRFRGLHVAARLILQEDLEAQAYHVQVVLLHLQQLLLWYYRRQGGTSSASGPRWQTGRVSQQQEHNDRTCGLADFASQERTWATVNGGTALIQKQE